jgi:hypothetical protein
VRRSRGAEVAKDLKFLLSSSAPQLLCTSALLQLSSIASGLLCSSAPLQLSSLHLISSAPQLLRR